MSSLTPMELAILEVVRNAHWPLLDIERLEVARREHTGVGRYTHFVEQAEQELVDGTYGADACYVEMAGVPNGLYFAVEVANSQVLYMEIVSAGDDVWDGAERAWRMAAP